MLFLFINALDLPINKLMGP